MIIWLTMSGIHFLSNIFLSEFIIFIFSHHTQSIILKNCKIECKIECVCSTDEFTNYYIIKVPHIRYV